MKSGYDFEDESNNDENEELDGKKIK